MEFSVILLVVLLVAVLVLIWLTYTNKSTTNESKIANEVLIGMNKMQAEAQDRSATNALNQAQKLNDALNSLEIRFGEMQTKLNGSMVGELGKIQQIQSEQMARNRENMVQMQNEVLKQLNEALANLNKANGDNFAKLAQTNNEKLSLIQGEVDKRLAQSFEQHLKSFESVNKNLGALESTAQKMIDSTKSVDKLNNIFERTNSKGFGQFSETYLETILENHLNHHDWEAQVKVPGSNDMIDFVVSMGDKTIGIDSKFPITKYQDYVDADIVDKPARLKEYLKAVQLMAADISKKYLQPGFLDTLLMFLPSDSMYNEVVNNPELSEKLQLLKVTPISPTTIFPIIVVINSYEFRLKVNENAEAIIKGLQGVSKNVDSFREEFRKLGDKLNQAKENYDKADKNLVGLQTNIAKLEHVEESTLLESM
jgi:DNA recombination protein RmuC